VCSQPAVAPRAASTPTDRSNGRPIQPRLTDRAAGVKTDMDAFTEALTRASVGVGPLIEKGLQNKAA